MMSTEQMPGVYRRLVGDVLVTALSDGSLVLPLDLLQNSTPAEAEATLRGAGRRPPFATAINAFVLQWPGLTVLVDTGAGTLVGPGSGKLARNLQEAGLSAASIDAVLMTHLHGDHAGGLIDGDGNPAFPNAKLLVPEAEMAFWLDDTQKAAAPEARRGSFDVARQMTAPYGDGLQRVTGTSPLSAVEAVPLPGHTPGHTGYVVGGGSERLLIWGDTCHMQESRPAARRLPSPSTSTRPSPRKAGSTSWSGRRRRIGWSRECTCTSPASPASPAPAPAT